jgi:hypothetical protein
VRPDINPVKKKKKKGKGKSLQRREKEKNKETNEPANKTKNMQIKM